MDKKSKLITGLKPGEIIKRPNNHFSDSDKHFIIQEMLKIGCTKREIWEKYTGQSEEHGQLLIWMRELGYDNSIPTRKLKFASNTVYMSKKRESSETFETLQLEKRIAELEKQLKDAEMKAVAFSTMVDIAEKEFNISIRKKYNTKPSKK